MADDADDVQVADITPDDFLADEQDAAKTDPSPVKTKEPEVAKTEEPKEEVKADDTATPDKEEPAEPETDAPEAEKPQDDETETDKPLGKAEERKQQLNTEIRDLVSKRNAIRAEVEKTNSETYQPATENELVGQVNPETGQPFSSTDAKVEALRQEIEMRNYNEQVAEVQLTLSSQSERVLQDFPWANAQNKDAYNKELAEDAARHIEQNLIRDPNTNQIIGSNLDVYDFYQMLNRASGNSAIEGQLKGQQDTEQMLANADSPASTAPTKKAVDPVIALWESDD